MKKSVVILGAIVSLFAWASVAAGQSFYGTADFNAAAALSTGTNLGLGVGDVTDIMTYEAYLSSLQGENSAQLGNANDFVQGASVNFPIQAPANDPSEVISAQIAQNNPVVALNVVDISHAQQNKIVELISPAPVLFSEIKSINANDFTYPVATISSPIENPSDFVFVNENAEQISQMPYNGTSQPAVGESKRVWRIKNTGNSSWNTNFWLMITAESNAIKVRLPYEVAAGQAIDLSISGRAGLALSVSLIADSGEAVIII